MLFEEYKKIFEEILAYTEEIAKLYKNNKIDEAQALFSKRSNLMNKLTPFEDVDEEKVNYIISLRGKIQELNKVISQHIAKQKENLKNMPQEAPVEHNETPKYNNINFSQNMSNSIFDFKKK